MTALTAARAGQTHAQPIAAPNAQALRRVAQWERLGLLGLVAPALLLIGVTMLAPVGWLFYLSLLSDDGQWSFEHYQRMWEQPSYWRTFATTFGASAVVLSGPQMWCQWRQLSTIDAGFLVLGNRGAGTAGGGADASWKDRGRREREGAPGRG